MIFIEQMDKFRGKKVMCYEKETQGKLAVNP